MWAIKRKRHDDKPKYVSSDYVVDVPKIIESRNAQYECLECIGSGSYGKCYEVINITTGLRLACKVLSYVLIHDADSKKLVQNELTLHSRLKHEHVVKFVESFEDGKNIYMIQSLCSNYTLEHLQKLRTTVELHECRYFVSQILKGLLYIHKKGIIHRDIKLSNILIDHDMQMKIGDFGLAITVKDAPSDAHILCGTTNYLAPEALQLMGFKRRSDVWAVGVIAFILTCGHKPFEEGNEAATKDRINAVDYRLPDNTDSLFKVFLQCVFEKEVESRLNAEQCLNLLFFKKYIIPNALPVKAFSEATLVVEQQMERSCFMDGDLLVDNFNEKVQYPDINVEAEPTLYHSSDNANAGAVLKEVFHRFNAICIYNTSGKDASSSNWIHQSGLQPDYWVVKWSFDVISGFAYQLCDASIGTIFHEGLHYLHTPENDYWMKTDEGLRRIPFDKDTQKYLMRFDEFEKRLKRNGCFEEATSYDRKNSPRLLTWFQTNAAMVMLLSNNTVQINFSKTHQKVLICPHNDTITFVSNQIRRSNFKTVSFAVLTTHEFSAQDFQMFQHITAILRHLAELLKACKSF